LCAALLKREMRRAACALWMTPLLAAFAIWRTAALRLVAVLAASVPSVSRPSRNLRTAVRTVELMCELRARCLIDWRFAFSADFVLAT